MTVAIVGVAEGGLGITGQSALELLTQASLDAMADAGIQPQDVDGLATAGWIPKFAATSVSEYLGIRPRWYASTSEGGSTFEQFVADAARAIEAGDAETVLICYGSDQRSGSRRTLSSAVEDPTLPLTMYDLPFAPLLPISAYALAACRHMHEFGTTEEQLASVAVSASAWARLNPEAYRHKAAPLTVRDALSTPLISSPLRRADCCLVTDGAAAIVLMSADRARAMDQRSVTVLGWGSAATHRSISQAPDAMADGATRSSRQALNRAQLRIDDIDVVEIYDSFTITVLLSLEALGICGPGESGDLAASGALGPGGSRPVNTNGGGLAHGHPGMYGLFLIVEAVRQLRGDAGARQLERARTAICHGTGGYLNTHATVVLGSTA